LKADRLKTQEKLTCQFKFKYEGRKIRLMSEDHQTGEFSLSMGGSAFFLYSILQMFG
jgi:hypothetical protein